MIKAMNRPKCKECNHRRSNTCTLVYYDDGKPYVIASASAFEGIDRLAFKTAPHWCPLKKESEDR